MSITPKDYVEGALRYLQLDENVQAEMKTATKPEVFEKIEAEAAAVQWVLGACLCWHEHGVLDEVLGYIREQATGQLEIAA